MEVHEFKSGDGWLAADCIRRRLPNCTMPGCDNCPLLVLGFASVEFSATGIVTPAVRMASCPAGIRLMAHGHTRVGGVLLAPASQDSEAVMDLIDALVVLAAGDPDKESVVRAFMDVREKWQERSDRGEAVRDFRPYENTGGGAS